jgi:glycosyltransferase involved in cell wall biosynthesis
MTALRIARYRELPLVFTHHTLYESYTHYVPGDSPVLKRFIIDLATRYANLSDQVFAPSESIRDLLLERGVTAPLQVVPTGVRPELFAHGDGRAFRLRHGVPEQAVVIGHLGRLAPEKNLAFLTEAVAGVMQGDARVHFLVVGHGPAETSIRGILASAGVAERLHTAGILQHPELADALHAMDLFAFTSTSETQGMVLSEAMAAGLPVAALDAPGAREVVRDRENGRLVTEPTHAAFRAALEWLLGRSPAQRQRLATAARATAERFSMAHCAATARACYASLRPQPTLRPRDDEIDWHRVRELIKAEWEIIKSVALAGDEALGGGRE